MNRLYKRTSHGMCMAIAAVALAAIQHPAKARGDAAGPAVARAAAQGAHPLDPALRMSRDSLRHIQENVRDYTAVFVKRLRINGELNTHQFAFMKFRNRKVSNGRITTPMSVYLKFLRPSTIKDREVIWVEGENDGKLVAHETGLKNLIRFNLDPNGFVAMRGQKHPITEIGLENLVTKVIETGERDRKFGECEVRFFENAKVGDRVCTMVQVVHPVKRPHFDFYVARVFFDNELNIPIRYASWSWPTEREGKPALEEEYTYTDLELNVGLTDADFDPDNPRYGFP